MCTSVAARQTAEIARALSHRRCVPVARSRHKSCRCALWSRRALSVVFALFFHTAAAYKHMTQFFSIFQMNRYL